MTRKSYEAALEAHGYTVLMSVGFGMRPDGAYSLKLAASPMLKSVSDEHWEMIRDTLIKSLDQLRETPMDDLEFA